MASRYWLTEQDRNDLRAVFDEWSRSSRNPRNRTPDTTIDREEMLPPEVYVARTPSGGIPANDENTTGTGTSFAADDQPGSAECQFYQTVQDPDTGSQVLQALTDFTRTVYNLSATAIDGDSWILAVRDKFGLWYAVNVGAAAPTVDVGCRYVKVVDKICFVDVADATGTGTHKAVKTVYQLIDLTKSCSDPDRVASEWCEVDETGCCEEPDPGTGTITADDPAVVPDGYLSGDCCADYSTTMSVVFGTSAASSLYGLSFTMVQDVDGVWYSDPQTVEGSQVTFFLRCMLHGTLSNRTFWWFGSTDVELRLTSATQLQECGPESDRVIFDGMQAPGCGVCLPSPLSFGAGPFSVGVYSVSNVNISEA